MLHSAAAALALLFATTTFAAPVTDKEHDVLAAVTALASPKYRPSMCHGIGEQKCAHARGGNRKHLVRVHRGRRSGWRAQVERMLERGPARPRVACERVVTTVTV